MGLIKSGLQNLGQQAANSVSALGKGVFGAGSAALGGVLSDQWKEYFYCEAIPENVLMTRGVKRTQKGANKGSDNIISNGSVVAVADGQCMIIVDQGKVVDICAEPGEFVYDTSSEPSIFTGSLGDATMATFKEIGKRFTFGGEAPKDQRVYYFNTKEILGNKFGTPTSVPFRVVDQRAGIDIDVSVRCFGEYSYKITNPVLFYTNVCGNVSGDYTRDRLESSLKTDLLTALQPAFAKLSAQGVRYSELPGRVPELTGALNDVLSPKWRDLRGIELVSAGVSSVNANEEDEKMLKELQRNAAFRDPGLAAANLAGAQMSAMKDAANNKGGAAVGFMGMNMAQGMGGFNLNQLYQQAGPVPQPAPVTAAPVQQPEAPKPEATADSWTCQSCGKSGNTGKFCSECGTKKPEDAFWFCPECGRKNEGKFCPDCGTKKP